MKTFLVVISIFVIFVHGRPEVGYNYRQPVTGNVGGGGGGIIGIGGGGGGGGGVGHFIAGNNYQQTGSFSSGGSSSFGSGIVGGGGGVSNFIETGFSGGGSTSGGIINGGHGTIGFGGINSGGFGGGGNFIQGPPLIQKHIYVHVPPPEPEEFQPQRQISSIGTAQKHYKIIFIKAPTYETQSQQQIALAAQNQEKTIVYVLVKKPDDIGDISLPSIAPTQPSKPEVYFIKYKTQKQTTGVGGGGGVVVDGGNSILTGSTGHGISSGNIITGSTGASGIGGSLVTGGGGGGSGIGSITTGSSGSSSIGGSGQGIPAPQYGPPGKSGPY